MIKFDKPEKLNGSQLIRELRSVDIKINDQTSPFLDGNGDFWLDIAEADIAKASKVVEAHIGLDESLIKIEARQAVLTKLGLTPEEAKLLLSQHNL